MEKIKYWIFAVAGFAILICVTFAAINTNDFVKYADTADGKVIALNAGGSHPQIRFITKGGTIIEYPQNGLVYAYQVGNAIAVFYNPKDPRDACINDFGALWGFHILGFILGSVFIGIAGAHLLSNKRRIK